MAFKGFKTTILLSHLGLKIKKTDDGTVFLRCLDLQAPRLISASPLLSPIFAYPKSLRDNPAPVVFVTIPPQTKGAFDKKEFISAFALNIAKTLSFVT